MLGLEGPILAGSNQPAGKFPRKLLVTVAIVFTYVVYKAFL